MVTAIIVDDETHSRNVLRTLLSRYCPDIHVITDVKTADEAYNAIQSEKPELVFLDVRMPEKTGFDLLQMFDSIDFEVIFISAFNEYAVTAFDFNALGYVLKPIDHYKLVRSVDKAISKIRSNPQNSDLSQFIKTLEPETQAVHKVALHHNEKVILVNIKDIIYIEADYGICNVQLTENRHYHSSKELKLFENLLRKNANFFRINRHCIVNIDFIKSYKKGETCQLEMIDGRQFEVSRRKKTEVLHLIKSQ